MELYLSVEEVYWLASSVAYPTINDGEVAKSRDRRCFVNAGRLECSDEKSIDAKVYASLQITGHTVRVNLRYTDHKVQSIKKQQGETVPNERGYRGTNEGNETKLGRV